MNAIDSTVPAPQAASVPSAAPEAPRRAPAMQPIADPVLRVQDFNFYYGRVQALKNISLDIPRRQVTAFIGPSGCGKSTLLRCFNRMNDLIKGTRMQGVVELDGEDIIGKKVDVITLRRRIGMVFQKSNPVPKSIFENVVYGLRVAGIRDRKVLAETCERSLRGAALWDEVKDRLEESAAGLSGGQQQRLCIARAIAVNPEVILMDEPCSALDPIATDRVESLIHELKEQYTVVIVTHNMQQAARVSDHTAFLYLGELIEYNKTTKIFTKPDLKQTEDYITGRFG